MGDYYWDQVIKEENGRWKCKLCNGSFSGVASRIKAHLDHIKGGGIEPCPYGGVHSHTASTSSNLFEDHQGVSERLSKDTISQTTKASSVKQKLNYKHQTKTGIKPPKLIIKIKGVNMGNCNQSVFKSDIDHLKQLVLNLECEEHDVTEQLQLLESRGIKRKPKVDEWLEEMQELKECVDDMNNLNDIEVNKLIKDMKRHKKEKPLILSTEFVGETLYINIDQVLRLLEEDDVFVIGIHGMGGVGKTLLATLVENEVKRKGTFDNVFLINVSSNFSLSKLQFDIAKRIGVKLEDDEEEGEQDERVRAKTLSLALETKGNSILILDDVWKYIDLQKVGIPLNVNVIKVILTTRLKHVCHEMDCMPDHMIQMLPLYHEDWELFMLKLGHDAPLPYEVDKIARSIVQRCEGLPLGINVMSRTMKEHDDIHQWKNEWNKLEQLEMGDHEMGEVFKVLKRSYDNLIDKNLQNCFLYCALLSSPSIRNKKELILKIVDNGVINENRCLEEIFNEGNTVLDKLESHSLINDMFGGSVVSTHRLMIDMACYIFKESGRNVMVKLNSRLTKISLVQELKTDLELVHMYDCDIEEISEDMSPYCPMISTMIINESSIRHVPESFFKYMNSVSILDLSCNRKLESLPNSMTKLRSLISLLLTGCNTLKKIPPLGELQALSRLVITFCAIEEVPQGLENLINLKWLDLSRNNNLTMKSGFVLSNLSKMQYLDLRCPGVVITVEDVQGMNKLEYFGGALLVDYYSQKVLDISFMLKKYHLILGKMYDEEGNWWDSYNLKSIVPCDPKTKTIHFGYCEQLSHFSHILPKDLIDLYICQNVHWGCLCDTLSYNDSSSLKKLNISTCRQLKYVFCLYHSCSFCTKIHNLEVLELQSLESLTVLCKDVVDVRQYLSPSGIFSCLKEFSVYNCNLLENLFTPRLVQQLQNLETIIIRYCGSMKEILVASNTDDDDSLSIAFPKLTSLELGDLPQLKIVCKGSTSMSLPKLTNLELGDLPQLKIFCKGSISCESLPTLNIYGCQNLDMYSTIIIQDVEIPYYRFCC
ncbi:probable disease resistance protein At1g61300 isoform X2 [Medicago truncatula]|nr:probable disease resistance protein At1g61300 isoform X2 [Medicago truncatula]XP_024627162.1 probable disease resistance protein At1g61300 isoform X2 [Medicago truncatula]